MDYRVYFNRKNEYPQIWSVDEGDQKSEINVSDFKFHRVSAESRADLSVKPNNDTPIAWVLIRNATLTIKDGVAHFFHNPNWRDPPIS